MWTLYFSQFFRSFSIGLPRICLCATVRNLVFIICSLPVGIDCEWRIKSWIMKATFSWMKNKVFCPQLSPQKAENRILGLWNFKIFWGTTSLPRHPPPLRKTGLMAHCWYSRLLYSNLLATSLFIESTCWYTIIIMYFDLVLTLKNSCSSLYFIEAFIFIFNIHVYIFPAYSHSKQQ